MKPTPSEYQDVCQMVARLCGISIGPSKEYLVESRLTPVLNAYGFENYTALIHAQAHQSADLLREQIIDAITTKETSFFRDGHPFVELKRSILPELCQRLINRRLASGLKNSPIRIWCAAASTGQEPFSVAMSILDFISESAVLGPKITAEDFWILATDISPRALRVAKEGCYGSWELDRGISTANRAKYFSLSQKLTPTTAKIQHTQSTLYEIAPHVQRMVDYRQLNLATECSDLTGFDLIFCRNVLIYFDMEMREQICQNLHRALTPSGFLVLGSAESLPPKCNSLFQPAGSNQSIIFQQRKT